MAELLKIAAMDSEDLSVLSAHVQDGVIKSGEIGHIPASRSLVLPLNRFAWEAKPQRTLFAKTYQRRRSVLHFDKVNNLRSKGIDRNNPDEVLALLALVFHAAGDETDPSGVVEIQFSGGAALQMDVECIEVRLTDLGAAWAASGLPRHGT